MKKIIKFVSTLSLFVLFPIITLAQVTVTSPIAEACTSNGFGGLLCRFQQILNSIVPVLIALGVVYFVWGVVQYVIAGGEEAKKTGRDRIIFGLIGFASIIGLWGLVNILVTTFGVGGGTALAPATIAGGNVAANGISVLLAKIKSILDSIVPVLMSLGVVYFVWGVVQYVIAGGEEAKKTGKDKIIYGLIGFVAIVGLWGLVNILVTTFGLENSVAPTLAPLTGTAGSCSLSGNPKLQDLLCYMTSIINNSIIPLIFALATAVFVWGIVQFFIIGADEEAKRAKGKQFMIWGIVALAVMLSVWGLVKILGSTLNINSSVLPQVHPPTN